MAKALFSKKILTTTNTGFFFKIKYTRGPRISWFLVPKSNHEMQGSWIPRSVFSVKPQNGFQKIWKSTFWAFFPDDEMNNQLIAQVENEYILFHPLSQKMAIFKITFSTENTMKILIKYVSNMYTDPYRHIKIWTLKKLLPY